MFTMHTPPAPSVPDRIPSKGNILSPEWTHAFTTIMGHPLSSESGKCIQKWILYHAIQDPSDFLIYWDPTDPDDIKLLQEYVASNGSVAYLLSITVKSLISLWNYMNLLIKKGKSADQKCNVLYFLQDDHWFNLTAHDMKTALVNAGMEYHRPQIIPGTSLPNSTSPPSPAPMKSPIHLELTPYDSTSTTSLVKKTCPVNTSCDHLPHLDHPSTSPEPQDHSIVGSAEPESILHSEDLLQLDSISVSSQATCSIETEFLPELKGQLDDTNLSPADVFSGHYDYELFLLKKEIDAPHDNLNHHGFEEQHQDVILTHATILSHTFALPQFMDQHKYEDQEPTDTPTTVPTAFQVACDHALHPECTHNLMATQCNQYPNLRHNSALPQFLAHHNCEDFDPIETPSAVPTSLQAPSDDTYNPKCAHKPMETQCNQSQYPILMKRNCTHNPSTSQIKKCYHSNPVTFPYPPDPGEHVLERSATPTVLVERDKLDLSSLAPPKGEMESSFSWTYPFKSPTSTTLCFGEPTLRKLNQVKLMCNPISSTLCDFTLGKLNQETEFYITKHMQKSSSGTNRVSVCHSILVTTSSSRWILDKPRSEVTKTLIHHIGKNGEHFYGDNFIHEYPKSWRHIKSNQNIGTNHGPNYTSSGCTLKEDDWGDKLKLNNTSYGCMLMEIEWKLTGEAHSTAPYVDVLWLTGMSPCSLKLIGEHMTQVSSSFW